MSGITGAAHLRVNPARESKLGLTRSDFFNKITRFRVSPELLPGIQ
jgi:hypothetical protein